MSEPEHACCQEGDAPRYRPWYRSALFLISIATGFLFLLSFIVPPLNPFRQTLYDYLRMMWLPVSAGLLLGGLIDYYIPQTYISKHLASPRKRTVFYAVGLGFLASACSHGVLALSMELHKKGASASAVISFLLASPWASLPVTLLLIGFFGWKAFLIIGFALLIAIVTGLVFQLLSRLHWIESNPHQLALDASFSIRRDLLQRIRTYQWNIPSFVRDSRGVLKGSRELAKMVLLWILVGIVLASLAGALVPSHLFDRYLSKSFPGLLLTMVFAALLEVCSEGTSPLAFEIYAQTGALGNAFAFLLGGVVTDFTEVALVWANLGKKTALWMLVVALPQVIGMGWILNQFF